MCCIELISIETLLLCKYKTLTLIINIACFFKNVTKLESNKGSHIIEDLRKLHNNIISKIHDSKNNTTFNIIHLPPPHGQSSHKLLLFSIAYRILTSLFFFFFLFYFFHVVLHNKIFNVITQIIF